MNNLQRNRQTGVAMVEFAIILPFLLLMLYGITELGRALYQQNTLYKGLMAGSRYMARAPEIIELDPDDNSCSKTAAYTNYGGSGESIEAKTKQLIVSTMADFPGFSAGNIVIDVPNTAVVIDDVAGCTIRITTTDAKFNALFVPLDTVGFDSFNIHAEIEERYIGL